MKDKVVDPGVYVITCTANNKKYVGSSINVKKRLPCGFTFW